MRSSLLISALALAACTPSTPPPAPAASAAPVVSVAIPEAPAPPAAPSAAPPATPAPPAAGAKAGTCATDADCTLASDYCTSCLCRALGPGEGVPKCDKPGVRCFRDPCGNGKAKCSAGKCTFVEGGAAK